jgi:hypothetical protein
MSHTYNEDSIDRKSKVLNHAVYQGCRVQLERWHKWTMVAGHWIGFTGSKDKYISKKLSIDHKTSKVAPTSS